MFDPLQYSLPKWPAMRWLTGAHEPIDPRIHAAQIRTLYGTPGVFYAAMVASFSVALAMAVRNHTAPFLIWLALEIVTIGSRILLLRHDRIAAQRGQPTQTDLYLLLTLIWGASMGYGAAISILSGDIAAGLVAATSCASISGGMCIRYFGAPRFVVAAICVTVAPLAVACLFHGDPILMVTAVLTPLFVFSLSRAGVQLNAMMNETMQARLDEAHRAVHDPLTGLLNRAGFSQAIGTEHRRLGEQAGGGATLFYIDLDGFKQVNDRLGHAAGDAVLVQVGRRLSAMTGVSGHAARLGGDEFVLLLPGMDPRTMQWLGERIVTQITDQEYIAGQSATRIGASVGAASMGADDTPENALCRADEALYRAKTTGGQTVALAA